MWRSGNPVLRDNTFSVPGQIAENDMTVQGTVNKTFLALALVIVPAAIVWGNPAKWMPFMWVFIIAGFVLALITAFVPKISAITVPLYAVVEGGFLGVFSSLIEKRYPGIVIQAVSLTFGTLFCLLLAYKSRIIKATENFKLGVFAATGGIFLVYLVDVVLGFFGRGIPSIGGNGVIGIGFSVFVVIIAALNLVIDFDFIESGAERGAPKYMEWYGAFGLLVTLIWLYIEILRLLTKLRSRN
jgi:uncharacterized YccA/Bax inhibitor family protein